MKTCAKIIAVVLAFVPMIFYFLIVRLQPSWDFATGLGRYFATLCKFFFFPVLGLFRLTEVFRLSQVQSSVFFIGLMLIWSAFVAWLFIQMLKEFRGENEPEYESDPARAKFDWVGFQVRFVCGCIIGLLTGWEFVRQTNSWAEMFGAMTAGGIFVGLILGFSRRNFWSRN